MENIVIFGAGKTGMQYVKDCIESKIEQFMWVDSNPNIWNKRVETIRISAPGTINWSNAGGVVICTEKEQYKEEIWKELTQVYKVQESKIVDYRKTIILSPEETYNWGDIKQKRTIDKGIILSSEEIEQELEVNSKNKLEYFFLSERHNTLDKWFHYFEAYDRFFSRYRNRDVSILEIGVYKGGSLQMWKNYFSGNGNKVQIYGIDIDTECRQYEEDNIHIYTGSQEDREFLREIRKRIGHVDIVIDDGGHTMNQQIVSFEELFDMVDENGIYLCEDCHTSYMEEYGGAYKGETFIEYTKDLIDKMHAQYSKSDKLEKNNYSQQIKSITYYDSMVFIEKKEATTKAISIQI